jgi:predicted Na+-dependent transporter
MKRMWRCIYLLLVAAAFLAGTGLFGRDFGQTNVDWVFVLISFLTFAAFPKLAISYACHRKPNHLPSPSLSRGFVGGWWTDPAQCVLLTAMLLCGWFLGSLLTLPQANHQGIMIVWWQGSMALGIVVGGFLARSAFRGSAT